VSDIANGNVEHIVICKNIVNYSPDYQGGLFLTRGVVHADS
jgi:hypothetical protein